MKKFYDFFKKFSLSEENEDIMFIKQANTIAVIEIVLKQRLKMKDDKELMIRESINLGMNESHHHLINTYSKFIRTDMYILIYS